MNSKTFICSRFDPALVYDYLNTFNRRKVGRSRRCQLRIVDIAGRLLEDGTWRVVVKSQRERLCGSLDRIGCGLISVPVST